MVARPKILSSSTKGTSWSTSSKINKGISSVRFNSLKRWKTCSMMRRLGNGRINRSPWDRMVKKKTIVRCLRRLMRGRKEPELSLVDLSQISMNLDQHHQDQSTLAVTRTVGSNKTSRLISEIIKLWSMASLTLAHSPSLRTWYVTTQTFRMCRPARNGSTTWTLCVLTRAPRLLKTLSWHMTRWLGRIEAACHSGAARALVKRIRSLDRRGSEMILEADSRQVPSHGSKATTQ